MKFQRFHQGEHLKSECEYRNVKCDFCGKDVAFASMKEHVDTICDGAPVTCKYCNKKDILRTDIERHERRDCEEVPATCEFQAVGCNHAKTLTRKDLRHHLIERSIDHGGQLLRYTFAFNSQLNDFIPRTEYTGMSQKIQDDMTEVRSSLAEKFVMIVEKLTGLERRVESLESSRGGDTRIRNEVHELTSKIRDLTTESSNLRESNTSLERELRDKVSIIDRLRSKMNQMDESLALNTVKITDLQYQRGTCAQQAIYSYNGTLLWKIEGYQRKRQDAINGVKTALYSPPFYSAQYGYKVCAKIYMNGDGFGKGSHLSLFFVVMRGDYDALQTWPFRKKITMMLLDQGNGDHMIDAFNSDPQS
ncbi:TNF receptor-associated factor 3-like [Paramuricea clavata]|uniref:TNF receptor-associated factor 3-like n=1 Tax=Paramuricea clavata TaxID=317549 RepID=A0A6S7J774_PARCT|nr:TNF receptor-associated factor 3-like [Paramuricea clavata]